MKSAQALEIIREIEQICRDHGLYYTKVLDYRENYSIIRLQEISVKIEKNTPPEYKS